MATRLFVGNLPDNTSEQEIRNAFSNYGEITNLDLKSKSEGGNEKKFAFVTISGSNYDIETCIKYFLNEDFNGNRLYVTRARESFLERLQRERLEAQQKEAEKNEERKVAKNTPVLNLGDKLNPRKRKIEEAELSQYKGLNHSKTYNNDTEYNDGFNKSRETNKYKTKHDLEYGEKPNKRKNLPNHIAQNNSFNQNGDVGERKFDDNKTGNFVVNKKKQDSDLKRIEAMKKKSQEFKQKKMIVKSGLTDVDKAPNKKIVFSDNEEDMTPVNGSVKQRITSEKKNTLFDNDDDDEDSSEELNFEIKKQFEGKKGQKVLDLQSRYKSDKRFVLDERFIEDEGEEPKDQEAVEDNEVELNQEDEKAKQLNILQDVLGVPFRKKVTDEDRDGKKLKPKLGMLRFDPSQPEHAKFLAPVDTTQESTKKSKKKKDKTEPEIQPEPKPEEPRPEVSKEQFYKISDTLKEAISQPTTFSLRSLFGTAEPVEKEFKEDTAEYTPLEAPKKPKVKNPLQPGEKNPFVYDSSESEDEVEESKTETAPVVTETKAVWKENFFFGHNDQRFEEGVAFFTNPNQAEAHKERRELKSLMKKRIYNKERKDQMQMFRKKIGGRKKTMKKSFKRKT